MKKSILFITSLLLMSCSNGNSSASLSNTAINSKDVDVIVLCGQSNAEGNSSIDYLYKNASEEDNLNFLYGYKNTLIRYNVGNGNYSNDKFEPIVPGQGHTIKYFGPEVGMANYLKKINYSKKVYVIKYAVGGTTLYNEWTSPNNPYNKQKGELYQGINSYVARCILDLSDNLNLNPTIKAICWMQGESDSHSDRQIQYQELENAFIDDITSSLGKLNTDDSYKIKFVDAYISDSPNWPFYKVINDAKLANKNLDPENRFLIETKELAYDQEPNDKPDLAHYDALAELELGELFSKCLVDNKII